MLSELPLFPPQASTAASQVDALFFFILAVSVFFASLICICIVVFAVKYRRRSEDERGAFIEGDLRLEILWTVIPLGIGLVMFVWGARIYYIPFHPPRNALEITVVAKQWMWKAQHPEGRSEIDELHVPIGRAIKLMMTSQDVIHSFYVPAFRAKMDVLPGRYTSVWFEPSKAGEYHLFCAEYCGTQHWGMRGRIVVMDAPAYENWLGGTQGAAAVSMPSAGQKIFQRLACNTCHLDNGTGRGPSLVGLIGNRVRLQGGQTITADENYIRESILEPQAKVVAGYPPIMPTFKGLVSEEGVLQMIAYIKSLSRQEGTQARQ